MAKMRKAEKEEFLRVIDRIRGNMSDADELRKEIFYSKPSQIEKIRLWFNHMPGYQLPKDEREQVLKRYKTWEVFKTLMTQQRDIDSTEIMEFYNAVGKMSKSSLWFTVLQSDKAYDEDRMEILEEILNYNNFNYHKTLLHVIDRELSIFEASDFWKSTLVRLVEYINSDLKNSQSFADLWESETSILDYVIEDLNLTSRLLYDTTGKEVFLPQEAKDIFIF